MTALAERPVAVSLAERGGIPEGWIVASLGDATIINPPKPSPESLDPQQLVTFVPMAAVDADRGTISDGQVRPHAHVRKGFTAFAEGDVIFAKITPCMENGKSAVARDLVNGWGFGSTEFHVLRPLAVEAKYLHYFLRQKLFRVAAECEMTGSVGQRRVQASYLAAQAIPIPPPAEQRRIVERVDELLDQVDAVRARLARVSTLLKRFRQSVLDAAGSGRLTEEWRAENGYSAQIPVALASVASGFWYGTAAKSSRSGRVPVLRMGNIQDGSLDWPDLVYTNDEAEIAKYRLSDGDVLFNRTNSPELVGKTAVFRGNREAVFAGYLIRVACGPQLVPEYLSYCLNSPEGRDYCQQVKSDGVSQSNINAKKLAAFEFQLPSVEEQHEIVRRVESAFDSSNAAEAMRRQSASDINRLREAILAKAFRGELVPTEAELARQEGRDYESGEQLLARIAAERVSLPHGRRRSSG